MLSKYSLNSVSCLVEIGFSNIIKNWVQYANLISCAASVSYTHLFYFVHVLLLYLGDFSKNIPLIIEEFRKLCNRYPSLFPVSYTHLDVYKRQDEPLSLVIQENRALASGGL